MRGGGLWSVLVRSNLRRNERALCCARWHVPLGDARFFEGSTPAIVSAVCSMRGQWSICATIVRLDRSILPASRDASFQVLPFTTVLHKGFSGFGYTARIEESEAGPCSIGLKECSAMIGDLALRLQTETGWRPSCDYIEKLMSTNE